MYHQLIIFGAKYLWLAIVFVLAWAWHRESAGEKKRLTMLVLIAFPLVYIAAKTGSLLWYNERPFVTGNFIPLIPHAPDNGFPSDHTLISAAMASALFWFGRRKVAFVAFALALLVGTSRVLAGVHSWRDIAGSIIIACSVTWLVKTLLSRSRIKSEMTNEEDLR
jgi:undecaprenyl-diphosphatase